MRFTPGRVWIAALVLGLLSATLTLVQTAQAQCIAESRSDFCTNAYGLTGGISPIGARISSPDGENPAIEEASLPAAGALVYADYVLLEQRARMLLGKAVGMRESISPYKENNDFEAHLRQLDFRAGWENQEYGGAKPGYTSATTFAQLVAQLEADLTEARDLYAFLAVFGPESRFRADSAYISAGGDASLCGATDKEDPNPQSNPAVPTVSPPVIDWCNFQARLLQSVREVAYVRMIVGQEFMVDALGVNFSGEFVGGEEFVKDELAQLRAALHQFEQAETFLTDGIKTVVGNGCVIADFYTEVEWALLTQAAARQGTAQYHIATRESYLNIDGQQTISQAQAVAQDTLRQSANDAHLKLIGLAGLGAPVATHCAIGTRPGGELLAEIALNQLETVRGSQEMAAGLNIFGYDTTMTPARPYISSSPRNCDTLAQGDRGLWDEAWCSAKLAEALQVRQENTKRAFDTSQEKLNEAIDKIRQGLDLTIFNVAGCSHTGDDEAFFACTRKQIDESRECWRLARIDPAVDARTLSPPAKYPNFDVCMIPETAGGNIKDNTDTYTALSQLRSDFLAFQAIQKSAENINKQIQNSNDANATVTAWLGTAGGAETAARVSQAALDAFACVGDPLTQVFTLGSQAAVCTGLGATNGVLQGIAGAMSTAADVEIANAENTKEIKNLLLQMSELLIDGQSARQAFLATQSDVGGLIDLLERNLVEAERQRAYFATSPANDPSFRIVRDSARIELAAALERAARISYLAARRAEYEYADSLAAYNFAISDIYRARTAQDIMQYLSRLESITSNLPGSATRNITAIDVNISVAQDILLLTDDLLRSEGFTTPEAITAERTRRFREWVAANTVRNDFTDPRDMKPVLRFSFSTSLLSGGLFSNVFSQGYNNHWLLKLSGIDTPIKGSNGVSINLVSDEINLSHRKVVMTQGGTVHMSSLDGCVFDYRLIAPINLLGREWPKTQNAESVTAVFNANVNDSHAYTENGYRTPGFDGQAISATDWEIIVFAGTPQTSLGLPDMDLQQLTDIQLKLSVVYASRSDSYQGPPPAPDCARVDY